MKQAYHTVISSRSTGATIWRSLCISLPIILLSGAITYAIYSYALSLRLDAIGNTLQAETQLGHNTVTSRLHTAIADSAYLAKTVSVQKFTTDPVPHLLQDVAKDFLHFSQARSFYDQVRLILPNGKEAVRVNMKNGKPVLTDSANLQDKSNRDYVKNALSLAPGEIYVSELNLNVENGAIEKPFKPMIRFSSGIYDNEGRLRGIIVLNYNAGHILDALSELDRQDHSIYLLTPDGYWIKGPEPNTEWGWLIANRSEFNFAMRNRDVWEALNKAQEGHHIAENGVYTLKKIHLVCDKGVFGLICGGNEVTPQRHWYLLSFYSNEAIAGTMLSTKTVMGILFAVLSTLILLFSLLLSFLWNRRLSVLAELSDKSIELKKINRDLETEIQVRKRAEVRLSMSTARLTSIINAPATVGIIATDEDGLITEFNKGAANLLHCETHEVCHKKQLVDFHLAEELEKHARSIKEHYGREISEEEALTFEAKLQGTATESWSLVRVDGVIIPVREVISVLTDNSGNLTGFMCIIEDISESLRIEKMKKEFISTISHELRTPLTSILGTIGLICGGALGEIPEKVVSLLDIAKKNAERLSNLINDILTLDKIESGNIRLSLVETDLSQFVPKSVEATMPYAQRYNVDISIVQPLPSSPVNMDPERIEQVMANLLSNAVKFSPEHSEVTVGIRHIDNEVEVFVNDQGTGVPDAFEDRIFKKFAQADSSDTRSKDGTGLGLAISRAIIEEHAGIIGYKNHKDCGCTFYFRLPMTTS